MSPRVRIPTEKGRELLKTKLHSNCSSALRAANTVANKLNPLLTTANTSDIYLVKQYTHEFEQRYLKVTDSYVEFIETFAGDLDTLANFNEWNKVQIESFLLQRNITWLFNAPAASHHGGSWERLIRSTRRVMMGVIKEQILTDDGLSTLLAEVEAILNGRPLTRTSSDPTDLNCLTPNHLLLLKDQQHLPPCTTTKDDNYVRRRWRQIQYMSDLFWKRWIHEYLPLLQERQKWLHPHRNVQVGDIVLVVDQNAPRGSWPMVKVQAVFPDAKGFIRNVEIKTKSSKLIRPVTKLVMVLECDE